MYLNTNGLLILHPDIHLDDETHKAFQQRMVQDLATGVVIIPPEFTYEYIPAGCKVIIKERVNDQA